MRNLRLGNKFQTLMTRSAKNNRWVLHRQCDLYSLYLWPRVFVTVLNVKKIIKIYRHTSKHNFITEIIKSRCSWRNSKVKRPSLAMRCSYLIQLNPLIRFVNRLCTLSIVYWFSINSVLIFIHQICFFFRLGSARTWWGNLQRSPDPLAGL